MKNMTFEKGFIKFLTIVFTFGILWSCVLISCSSAKASDGKTEKPKEVIEAEYRAEGTLFNRIYHFEYNGHQYIQFVNGYYDPSGSSSRCSHKVAGVVHDPDCPCDKSSRKNDGFNIDF